MDIKRILLGLLVLLMVNTSVFRIKYKKIKEIFRYNLSNHWKLIIRDFIWGLFNIILTFVIYIKFIIV